MGWWYTHNFINAVNTGVCRSALYPYIENFPLCEHVSNFNARTLCFTDF